ncbi:hypothetical protein PFISCL1PPCAC_16275, partial [Pristionchus fissidentatus]
PAAVVLQRDDTQVLVWSSSEVKVETLDPSDCPANISVGTPIELKIDSRSRVDECRAIDKPLKVQKGCMFLDLFIFPKKDTAFSIYFGAVPVDSDFVGFDMDRSYLLYATWDLRSDELSIRQQQTSRSYPGSGGETKQICEAYEAYLRAEQEKILIQTIERSKKDKPLVAIYPMERREEPKKVDESMTSTNSVTSGIGSLTMRDRHMKLNDDTLSNNSRSSVESRPEPVKEVDRMEYKRYNESHSMTSRSSVTSDRESITMKEAYRKDNDDSQSNISSVKGSIDSRPEKVLPMREVDRKTAERESRPAVRKSSDVTRDLRHCPPFGSAVSSYPSAEEESVWVNGIVTGEHQSHEGDLKKFFVWTNKGSAIVYPRVHEKLRQPLRTGDYVKVEIRKGGGSVNYEVDDLVVSQKIPVDHERKIKNGTLFITCDVTYRNRLVDDRKEWWIAENEFLGLIGIERKSSDEEMIGRKATTTVKHLKSGFCLGLEKSNVGWIAADLPPAKKVAVQNTGPRLYQGMVTRVTADCLFVASGELKEDAILYQSHDPMSVVGKWVEFSIRQQPGDPIDRHRIDYFTEIIIPPFETRIKRGLPEIRLPLSYGGADDDGRALLQSEMGLVRDVDGLIPMDRDAHGQYTAWIIRYFKQGHIGRWRLSREDPRIVRVKEDSMNRREPSPASVERREMEEGMLREERLERMNRGNEGEGGRRRE